VVDVLALEKKPRVKRIEVRLDGAPSLSVTPDVAVQFGLRAGVSLSTDRLDALRAAQAREDAMATALRLVAYRPRSEKELRDRLRLRGVTPELVDSTVHRLNELRLLDDRSFAASWVQSRDASSPRSCRLMASELRVKGVARETTEDAVSAVDEADAAYRAARKRAAALTGRPYEEFRRKLGDFLLRRGFGYEVAGETVKRLWEETDGRGEPEAESLP
jgi:regulatory protein